MSYKPNGSGTTRTAYIKNLGWHFARYGNVPYADDPLYCIEPWRTYAASTSGNSVDWDVTLTGSGSTSGSSVWYALPEARRNAIGLILLYSNQMWDGSVSVFSVKRDSNPNVPLRVATQFLIYEIVCGLRDPSTFVLNSTNECGTAGDIFYGKLKIVKTVEDDGSIAGWKFKITDSEGAEIEGSPFTSDENGEIHIGYVLPGEYTIEELIPDSSLYYCKSENPQTVTITQGETAEVSFTNALRPGKITLNKVDTQGKPLAGATFLLEWSEEGSLWWPVEYSETVIEGCCTNTDIADGCLTSGKDGIIEWEGLYPTLYYRVTEAKAPDGYNLLEGTAYEGQLPTEDLTVSFTVVNARTFTLPETGVGSGMILRLVSLLAAIGCLGAGVIAYRRKRW